MTAHYTCTDLAVLVCPSPRLFYRSWVQVPCGPGVRPEIVLAAVQKQGVLTWTTNLMALQTKIEGERKRPHGRSLFDQLDTGRTAISGPFFLSKIFSFLYKTRSNLGHPRVTPLPVFFSGPRFSHFSIRPGQSWTPTGDVTSGIIFVPIRGEYSPQQDLSHDRTDHQL